MHRNRILLSTLLAVLLALSLAACGGESTEPTASPTDTATAVPATDTPVAEPSATPVPQPTETPVPQPTATPAAESATGGETGEETATPEPAAEETGDAGTFTAPGDALSSFRSRGDLAFLTTFEDGTTTEEHIQLDAAHVATDDQYGSNESLELTNTSDGKEETIRIYQVGEYVAIFAEGEWITVGRDQAGLYTTMAQTFTGLLDAMVVNMDEASQAGTETVNDIETVHYTIDDPAVFARMAQIDPESDEVIESVQLDMWVAQTDNYLLKYQIEAEVSNVADTDDAGNEIRVNQKIDWAYEVYDINDSDITVEFPEDVPEPGVLRVPGFEPGQFPIPPQTDAGISLFGTPELTSQLSEEEIIDFYQETLSDWTIEGEFGFYTFSKDDVSFTMFVSADEESGETTVTILPEQ